jgi:hypothetical protein
MMGASLKLEVSQVDEELLSVPASWPKAEAMFRAQIVAPLVDPLSTPEEKRQWRRFVTSREHTLPNGQVRRIAERTLRRWVAEYRQAGWRALERRPARTRGRVASSHRRSWSEPSSSSRKSQGEVYRTS